MGPGRPWSCSIFWSSVIAAMSSEARCVGPRLGFSHGRLWAVLIDAARKMQAMPIDAPGVVARANILRFIRSSSAVVGLLFVPRAAVGCYWERRHRHNRRIAVSL